MKVLVVVPSYPRENSSDFQFVHERIKEYKNFFDVEVYCYNDQIKDSYEYEGIKVICGRKNKLKMFCRKNKFDKIVFHYFNSFTARYVLKNLKNKETIIWFHGSDCISYKRRLLKLNCSGKEILNPKKLLKVIIYIIFYKYRTLMIKAINRKCLKTTFVFVSNWNKKTSEKDLNIKYNKSVVIPNYINFKNFPYKPKKDKLRYKVLSINNYNNLIYAGDVTEQIILKFSEYEQFKKFYFTIYGTGILFNKYTEKIKKFKNVKIFNQHLSHNMIRKLHSQNGIFLYPKRGDSQGVSRCEAMSSGLVSIASNVEAISEFSPSNTTYLTNSIQDFINSFIDIDKNEQSFLNKSTNSANFIRKKCSYKNTIQKEIDLIRG